LPVPRRGPPARRRSSAQDACSDRRRWICRGQFRYCAGP
jgi:hypothetical protein